MRPKPVPEAWAESQEALHSIEAAVDQMLGLDWLEIDAVVKLSARGWWNASTLI